MRVTPPLIEPATVSEYHAHVYYTPDRRAHARWLREEAGRRFVVRLGRWRETPVGPHPQAMYQMAFAPPVFGPMVAFLQLNRGPLDILVHPETGLGHAGDHSVRALWLGQPRVIDVALLDAFDAGRLSP